MGWKDKNPSFTPTSATADHPGQGTAWSCSRILMEKGESYPHVSNTLSSKITFLHETPVLAIIDLHCPPMRILRSQMHIDADANSKFISLGFSSKSKVNSFSRFEWFWVSFQGNIFYLNSVYSYIVFLINIMEIWCLDEYVWVGCGINIGIYIYEM